MDGANVVGSRPDGWWRDRAGAARRLAERLQPLAAGGRQVVLVLEGAARAGVAQQGDAAAVVHAPGAGDDTIVALLALTVRPDEWTVVTADRQLADRARATGAHVVGPATLWRALDRSVAT